MSRNPTGRIHLQSTTVILASFHGGKRTSEVKDESESTIMVPVRVVSRESRLEESVEYLGSERSTAARAYGIIPGPSRPLARLNKTKSGRSRKRGRRPEGWAAPALAARGGSCRGSSLY